MVARCLTAGGTAEIWLLSSHSSVRAGQLVRAASSLSSWLLPRSSLSSFSSCWRLGGRLVR